MRGLVVTSTALGLLLKVLTGAQATTSATAADAAFSCSSRFIIPSAFQIGKTQSPTPVALVRQFPQKPSFLHSSLSSSSSSSTTTTTESSDEAQEKTKEYLIQSLLQKIQQVGQIGSRVSESDQTHLLNLSKQLSPYSNAQPARLPLTGEHTLLYSASTGGSSGALGPFWVGKVTQFFVNEIDFINQVQFGPLEVKLYATRQVMDDERIKVTFRETSVNFLGIELLRKETKGQGIWKHVFVGMIDDYEEESGTAKQGGGGEGQRRLLRVLETPSLFVIEQKN